MAVRTYTIKSCLLHDIEIRNHRRSPAGQSAFSALPAGKWSRMAGAKSLSFNTELIPTLSAFALKISLCLGGKNAFAFYANASLTTLPSHSAGISNPIRCASVTAVSMMLTCV